MRLRLETLAFAAALAGTYVLGFGSTVFSDGFFNDPLQLLRE